MSDQPGGIPPDPVVQKQPNGEEDSSSEGSSEPAEEFHPYVPPLK